jgi:hypothetical protein
MAEPERKPWEQRPDEPEAAFVRFLIYLNLGPGRSLNAAYRTFLSNLGEATEGHERPQAPGQWHRDMRLFGWLSRARAWDVAVFSEVGREAAIALMSYVRALAVKGLEALAESSGPADWKDHLETIHALSSIIPQETFAALADAGGPPPEPEPGPGPQPDEPVQVQD